MFVLLLASLAPPSPADAALTERIRSGDHAAFAAFFDRHHADLLSAQG